MLPGVPLALGARRLDARLDLRCELAHARLLGELDPTERVLALDDPERAVDTLLLDEVVERPRLLHVLRYVRRERRRHLALLREPDRELRLLDRRHEPLRLRDELRLAQ